METNLIDALVTVPKTTASRSFGEHFCDKVNVRDFGAVGDGVTDDTAAIQAAVNYVCSNGLLLIFPQAQPSGAYLLSSQIVIPWNTHNWAIRGAPHRVQILQSADNAPFIHFDSMRNNTPALTNGGFDIANFRVVWKNHQPVGNTRAAVIQFNDGGYADFVIENLENANGCRCITTQSPGQTAGRMLNVWGCIFRHLYNGYSASGAAFYLRTDPTEGHPNIIIEHVYSVQEQAREELIHLAGATNIVLTCIEQNFCNYTPAFVGWAGTGNIRILGWRIEEFHWNDGGFAPCLFACNGALGAEYSIHDFEMRFNQFNMTQGDKYLIQASGARVKLDGFLDAGVRNNSGFMNLVQLGGPNDSAEIGISTIQSPNIRLCRPGDNHLSRIHFSSGSTHLRFDAQTPRQVIAEDGWIWSLRSEQSVSVAKNGQRLDVPLFNAFLKNENHATYEVRAGDVIEVSGKATLVIANL